MKNSGVENSMTCARAWHSQVVMILRVPPYKFSELAAERCAHELVLKYFKKRVFAFKIHW